MTRALVAGAATLALSAVCLSACETATPYQPVAARSGGDERGGYSDQQIETNRYRVEFSGNSLTSRQVVERYLLFRAAQLTVANGYDWFQSVDRHTDKQTSYYDDDFGGAWGPEWGLYRPGFGWGYGFGGFGPYGGFGYGGGLGGGFDVDQVTRYRASVEVVMGHGRKPPNPRAYDAHQVVDHLQASIRYPKTS